MTWPWMGNYGVKFCFCGRFFLIYFLGIWLTNFLLWMNAIEYFKEQILFICKSHCRKVGKFGPFSHHYKWPELWWFTSEVWELHTTVLYLYHQPIEGKNGNGKFLLLSIFFLSCTSCWQLDSIMLRKSFKTIIFPKFFVYFRLIVICYICDLLY